MKTVAFGLIGLAVILTMSLLLPSKGGDREILLFILGIVWGTTTHCVAIDRGWIR